MALPELVAHRGLAADYPENTLLAIRAAVQAGARYVEFDIQLSADLVPVLFHDRDMQRMCGVHGSVQDLTLAQLKTLSVHEFSRFGYKFVGNPITTLQELVTYLSSRPAVTAFVELKRNSLQKFGIATVLEKVFAAIAPIQSQCVIISYHLQALQAVRARSEYRIGAVFDHWRERKAPLLKQINPDYMFTDIDQLPRFGRLHAGAARLAVYECTDPRQALRVHRRGVDLVETFAFEPMQTRLRLQVDSR